MSNIFTSFVRVHAQPDRRIDRIEAEWITWMLLGPRGSYYVPVWFRCAPDGGYVDIQYGNGKSPDIVDFCDDHVGSWRYGAIWGRVFDEGGDQDVIWHGHVNDGPRGYCRYGFDEVRVTAVGDGPPVAPERPWRRHSDGSWRLAVAGSYRSGNDRHTIDIGPDATPATPPPEPGPADLATPTTPNAWGEALTAVDPTWLAPLADAHPGVTLIEYRWRGRLVHRAREDHDEAEGLPTWQHRCADGWDNCLDADFLRFTGATGLLVPEEVYERDRRDWAERAARWR